MTRSSSPSGAVEFSYDFPVPSTSALTPSPRRTHTRLPPPPSPVRPHWELSSSPADEIDDDEIDYDALGYPAPRPAPHALPHTKNQWRPATPPPFPFAPHSCDSESSCLSAYSAPPYAHTYNTYPATAYTAPAPHTHHAKIRKLRPASVHSSASSFDDDDDDDEPEQEEAARDAPPHECTKHALRRQWHALSLRVRFGVFRAKRRMRDRVMSL